MATKRTPGSRPGLIRCDHCGEEYSSSYRRCPFCDEYDEYEDSYDTAPSRSGSTQTVSRSSTGGNGGKRLVKSNRRGGGYRKVSALKIIGWILSLIVIIAAFLVVFKIIRPLVQQGNVDDSALNDPIPSNSQSIAPDTTPDVIPDTTPGIGEQPDVSTNIPAASETEDPAPTASSAPGTANGLSLNKEEFSFTSKYPDPVTLKVTFSPAGTSSTVTWTSSNTNYVTVDENGKVSPGPQKGTAIITATIANGVSRTCEVHNQVGSTSSSGSSQTSTSTSYSINKTDFTFYTSGEKTQLNVSGYSGSITWSSSNTSVATVSESGICKAIGNGKCTIYATLEDGTKLEAIARVKLS